MNRMNVRNQSYCCPSGYSNSSMMQRNQDLPSSCCQSTACCSPSAGRSEQIPSDLPVQNRRQLLQYITEEGFAVDETLLYLDTHPQDQTALEYFQMHRQRYQIAVKEYCRRFGPLTIDTVSASESEIWNWMRQPWPWEGGDC